MCCRRQCWLVDGKVYQQCRRKETRQSSKLKMASDNSCTLWPDTDHCRDIMIVQYFFSSISLLGCLMVSFEIWLYEKYHNYVQRLILCMSVSAALHATSYLIGNMHTEGAACVIQGFLMQFSGSLQFINLSALKMFILMLHLDLQYC